MGESVAVWQPVLEVGGLSLSAVMGWFQLKRRLAGFTRRSRSVILSLIAGCVLIKVLTERTTINSPRGSRDYLEEIDKEFKHPHGPIIATQKTERDNHITTEIENTEYLLRLLEAKLKDISRNGILKKVKAERPCQVNEDIFSHCVDSNCSTTPKRVSSFQNIQDIRKPINMVGGMTKLRETIDVFEVNATKKKYVFITGASKDHFKESEAAVKSLYDNVFPHLHNYSLIYYDLGLTKRQRKVVQNITGLEYKEFPFTKLPAGFQTLKCFIWKPLIVLAHLNSSEFLVWMDSSVYFAKDSHHYFEKVSKTGVLINRNEWLFAQHVYLKTFYYFGEKACHFSSYGEFEGGFLVFHNEPFVRHLVLEPWGACAMDEACMCPEATLSMNICDMKTRNYGKCHRFDQSVLGLILIKLFREFVESIVITNRTHSIKRGQRSNFMTNVYLGRQKMPSV